MQRRNFLAALAGVVLGLPFLPGRRARGAAEVKTKAEELVLVNGWIVKRSQAPEGNWTPAP